MNFTQLISALFAIGMIMVVVLEIKTTRSIAAIMAIVPGIVFATWIAFDPMLGKLMQEIFAVRLGL